VFRTDTLEGAKRELEKSCKRIGTKLYLFKITQTEEIVLY
jgi:hypothetical protein